MAGPENTAWIQGHGFPPASLCLVMSAASGQARQGGQALGLLGSYLRRRRQAGRCRQVLTESRRESNQGSHLALWENENWEGPDGAQLMYISSQEKAMLRGEKQATGTFPSFFFFKENTVLRYNGYMHKVYIFNVYNLITVIKTINIYIIFRRVCSYRCQRKYCLKCSLRVLQLKSRPISVSEFNLFTEIFHSPSFLDHCRKRSKKGYHDLKQFQQVLIWFFFF